MAPGSLNKYTGHLDQLQGALPILQSLAQVQNLTPHYTHLLFKHQPVKTFVRLEECVKVITDILDKVHVTQLVQHQVPRLMGERHLGSR